MVAESPPKTIAVFGAGVAGLTVAHELARLGHTVRVYEAAAEPGGFFRSARRDGELPSEYSWHGMGPWYHNVFDLLKTIPFDAEGNMYERALSRPIDFGIFPDDSHARFYDRGLPSIPTMFRFRQRDWVRWAWLMLKTWAANERTEETYSRRNAAAEWARLLSERALTAWRSSFGPWIGSDWTRVSLHTAGQFFRKQLITRPTHHHAADEDGPAWSQGAGSGWLLLRGPSSEYWFDRWVPFLEERGVAFNWNDPLVRLEFDGKRVISASLRSGASVAADAYVVAVNPFAAAEVIARSPALARLDELQKLAPLVADGPHIQVSFRMAFAERIRFARPRAAMVLADTEFNLTLFAQEQAWSPSVDLGPRVQSLWTGTSCVGTVPGRLYGLPVVRCTKEQFLEEVKAQIFGCEALNRLIAEANGGRRLSDFPLMGIEVWHEWAFSHEGIRGSAPKWVNSTNTQPHLPKQRTPVPNLFLAGAHTRTEADVWSIEGAVESGRRAAQGIDSRVVVLHQYKPAWLRALARVDDVCHRLALPHVLDLILAAGMVGAGALVGRSLARRAGRRPLRRRVV